VAEHRVTELVADAWKLGGRESDTWPRSRYSGYALRPGELVVTIVVTRTGGFGHSHVVFEWYADEVPGPRTLQRRHEVYHLLPAYTDDEKQQYRDRTEQLGRVSGGALLGIDRIRNLIRLAVSSRPGEVRTDTRHDYFPIAEGPSYYRSWAVPFDRGWAAREAARQSCDAPPAFNLRSASGAMSCATYARDIVSRAGIQSASALERVIGVDVPLAGSLGWNLVEAEDTAWQRRDRQRTG